ncbi:MAG: HipA domain-containing protein [Spirochaetota bacterium]|nr:type II toxin-antitoxin system HipA family toxin [Treponema sp.]
MAYLFGLDTAVSEVVHFEDITVLVVNRFDRRFVNDNSRILRIPQEDFCQITGTPPSNKYEADGGPGITSIMKILLGSRNAISDRENFFRAQVLFMLLAAPDGHGKNFSVFIERG